MLQSLKAYRVSYQRHCNENGHTITDVSTSVCHVEVSLGVPGPLQMRGGGWGGLPADWRYPQDIGASIC